MYERFDKALKRAILFIVSFLLASCVLPFSGNRQNINFNAVSTEFRSISQKGFMGGSVIYNPDNPASGHLSSGASLAIRLGRIDTKVASDGTLISEDRPNDAQYGVLLVRSINKDEVVFSIKLYDVKGVELGEESYYLARNESVDINRDGKSDLKYAPPVQKRPGMENAVYLTFISSQEDGYTSMFAVLAEQYSRGIYPSGIIGVNPEGKFIINKYEGTSGNRSMVLGVTNGDYVLDNTTGKYQRVRKTVSSRSARIIDEGELESATHTEDFYFTQDEFNELITPLSLFQSLPKNIQKRVQLSENDKPSVVSALNQLLNEQDLIRTIAFETGESLDPEVAAFVADTSALSETELVALNRLYLAYKYPSVCPQKDGGSSDITEILPLFSVRLGSQDSEIQPETNRAVTHTDYKNQKAVLQAKFDSYNKVPIIRKTYDDLFNYITQNHNIPDYLSNLGMDFGIKGTFSITYSNVNASFDCAINLLSENVFTLKKGYSASLIGGRKDVQVKVPVPVGPVTINLILKTSFDIPLTISGAASFSTNMFCGYNGIYGAGFCIGANYGANLVKWFKVFFAWVYRPEVYFSPYANGNFVNETVYYVGPQDASLKPESGIVNGASASVSIYPSLSMGAGIGVSVLQATYELESGLDTKAAITLQDSTIMNTSIDLVGKAKVVPAISIDLPFNLGKKDFSYPIVLGEYRKNLYNAVLMY
ncbi:hypothetical protein [Gracilinema caldarium]|uniref:hypothetical protein n=1 Tax=Gracilinema caldarium TaxID=215591 RepID=UPI0026EBAE3D|nr:hypothetical protein [Gracilinema caldarium]